MRSVCLLFANLVLLATAGLSDSKKWSTNKDSIIIEADYEEGTLADESADNIECRTIDGEVGQCVTVRRCHPILFTEDGAIRNKELAETFATSDSSCVSQSSNSSDIGSRTICCAVNKLLSSLRTGLDEELDPYPTTTDSILSDQSFGDVPAASTVDSLILQDNIVVLDDEPVQTTAPPFANLKPYNDLASETVVIENLNANAEDENVFQDAAGEGVAESTTVGNIAHDDNIATTNSILEGALSDIVVSEAIQEDEIVSTIRSVDDVVHDEPQTTVGEELQDEVTTPIAEVAANDSEESRIPEQIDIQDIVSQPDAPLADPEVITTQQTLTSSAASIENEDTAQTQQVFSSSSVAPEDIEAPIHTEPEITTVSASDEPEVQNTTSEASFDSPEVQNTTSEASFDSPEIVSSSPSESELQSEIPSSPSSIESETSTKISSPSSIESESSTKISSSPSSVESESSTIISSSHSSIESESSTKISSPSSIESESSTIISSSHSSVESESSTKIAAQEPEPQTEVPSVADPVEFPFEPEVSSPPAPIESETPTQSQPQPPTVEEPAQVHEDPNTPFDSCPDIDSYHQWPVLHNYPFLASILTRSKTGPLCSGALIDSRHVLTAAHCLHRFNSRDVAGMQVRLGFSKHRGNDTLEHHYIERRASKVILHKHFHVQNKMDNNIALVQLNKPVIFDEHVSPINIFREAPGFDAGNCTASQAGFIRFGNRVVTEIGDGYINFIEAPMGDFFLIESLSRVYSNEECNSDLNSQVTDQMVCAKPEVFEADAIRNIFKGNDGGPLLIKDGNRVLQIGIKSWAYEGNQYPTVYTRIDSYYKWIADNLKM